MSIRNAIKGVGVTILIGVPLIFAGAIFLCTLAFLIVICIYGWPAL